MRRATLLRLVSTFATAALLAGTIGAPATIAEDPAAGHRFLDDSGATTPARQTKAMAVAAAAAMAPGFSDSVVFSGLTQPTKVVFAPDGKIWVLQKAGQILYYTGISDTSPTVFADLSGEVNNFWDRGIHGLAISPNYASDHAIYVQYTWDHNPVSDLPGNPYGAPTTWNDACPANPGALGDGCPVLGRISKLTATADGLTWSGAEQVLITGWCQQFPSHSNDDLWFGPGGYLYSSAGDGASFTGGDYGQMGGTKSPVITPANPCGDPPNAAGTANAAPSAAGGALRAQSARRTTGSAVLNGALLRFNTNGNGVAGNPFYTSPGTDYASRILAFGLRNPYRFTFNPDADEIWIADVGYNTWEEIDKLALPTTSSANNFGWPCVEGNQNNTYYGGTALNLCTSLSGSVAPHFVYNHTAYVTSDDQANAVCPPGSSSPTGITFYTGSSYPTKYDGALFFGDYARKCIWAMLPNGAGNPDPNQVETIIPSGAGVVDIEVGPGGDIFYANFDTSTIHRLSYNAPQAVIASDVTSGTAPLTVHFDGAGSHGGSGSLDYSWNVPGASCDSTTVVAPVCTFGGAGVYGVRLTVTDDPGATTTSAPYNITVGGAAAPTVTIDTIAGSAAPPAPPTDGNGYPPPTRPSGYPAIWAVGDNVSFAGHAVDSAGNPIPASGLSWQLEMLHCPSNCHAHAIQTFDDVASGSLVAPDHDYPSLLRLTLTATDSGGLSASTSAYLYPKTAVLNLASSPSGLTLTAGTIVNAATPFAATFIVGGQATLSAAANQGLGSAGQRYNFVSWSNGQPANHSLIVPAAGLNLTATYSQAQTSAYLSDLTPTRMDNGWGPYERDMSNGEQAPNDGKPIKVGGVVYTKGLGIHANSDLRYTINGTCSTFTATAGLDAEVNGGGSVIFQVWLDGTLAYDSGLVTGTMTKSISVPVNGKNELRLYVDINGNGTADHADWADAKIACGVPAPVNPPVVNSTTPAANATGVSVIPAIKAVFNKAIDPATLTTGTFNIKTVGSSQARAATVTWSAATLTASLNLTGALQPSTSYLVTVKGGASGVKDTTGQAMAADKTWTFTTSASTTVYLSDRTPTTAINGWGPYERDKSNGEQAANDGHPLTLAGTVYAKGLGTHASSDLRYVIPGGCTTFAASIGIDDEVGSNGGVIFQVWADATKIYDSGHMTGASATQTVSVTVTGKAALKLLVVPDTSKNWGHGDWANARLVCSGAPPATFFSYLSDLSPTSATNGWGPYERDMSNGEQAAGDGHPIKVGGVTYTKGLGIHANSDLRYAIPVGCTDFTATAGIDAESPAGSVIFQVWLGATKVYDSGVVSGATVKTVSVPLGSATTLRLYVDINGNGTSDHADWANARLTCH